MKTNAMMKATGAVLFACGALAVAAASATAAGAVHMTPTGLAVDLGPVPLGQPGVTEVGNCPAAFATDDMQVVFATGNAVLYRDGNGGNVEGQAVLYDGTTDMLTGYSGHAHAWFGQNVNPNNSGIPGVGNQQQWFAETVSFNGSAADGTSVTISVSFGGGLSARGNESGWTHVKVTCS